MSFETNKVSCDSNSLPLTIPAVDSALHFNNFEPANPFVLKRPYQSENSFTQAFESKRSKNPQIPLSELLKTIHHVYSFDKFNDLDNDCCLSDTEYFEYLNNEAASRHLAFKKLKKINPCNKLSFAELLESFSNNRKKRLSLVNSKFPEAANNLPKIGLTKLNNSSFDFLLADISKAYKHLLFRKKQKASLFQKLLKNLDFNPIFARNNPVSFSVQQIKISPYKKKYKHISSNKIAKKVARLVMEKWNYIKNVLDTQRSIDARDKKIVESEKKLIKALEYSTDILVNPKELSSSTEYISEDSSSMYSYNFSSHTNKSSGMPEYFNCSSNERSSGNICLPDQNRSYSKSLIASDSNDSLILPHKLTSPIYSTGSNFKSTFTDDSKSLILKVDPHQLTTHIQDQSISKSILSILRCELRSYQQDGLEWLVKQHNAKRNSILADEMGLGKTIQTIALLDYIALNYGNWGPHLIIVPTSVLFNWEQEFKRWLPGFKVLIIYGSSKQRKLIRTGWSRKNAFHVCITSYQLLIQDINIFKRRHWGYLILDEAQNIKNFHSKRWQTLMQIKSERRLLLTGTPLQNSLNELWSLIYFLLPHSSDSNHFSAFADLEEFQTWFAKPLNSLIGMDFNVVNSALNNVKVPTLFDFETKVHGLNLEPTRAAHKLHTVLRPYILRRLKANVESQMPKKSELIVYCSMSTRQKYLYHEFISRAKTKESLQSGQYFQVMSCLVQLRKVCNHPDLFEPRPVITSWSMPNVLLDDFQYSRTQMLVIKMLNEPSKIKNQLLTRYSLQSPEYSIIPQITTSRLKYSINASLSAKKLDASLFFLNQALYSSYNLYTQFTANSHLDDYKSCRFDITANWEALNNYKKVEKTSRIYRLSNINFCRLENHFLDLCSIELINSVCIPLKNTHLLTQTNFSSNPNLYWDAPWGQFAKLVLDFNTKLLKYNNLFTQYTFLVPKVITKLGIVKNIQYNVNNIKVHIPESLQPYSKRLQISFPDKMLLQFDSGKLQQLYKLLNKLVYGEGNRILIFTQMSKMLDILEQFLAMHNYKYLRLDGSTKVEHRLALVEQFNNNTKYDCFLSSTRAGGLGINLTGANVVIFYDSDWNPSMDAQCQDRCHRIGQTRDVKIYRLITVNSIEENIWQKAVQKRILDQVVIQDGNFDTITPKDRNLMFNWKNVAEKMLDNPVKQDKDDIRYNADKKDCDYKDELVIKKNETLDEDLKDLEALRDAMQEMDNTYTLDFVESSEINNQNFDDKSTKKIRIESAEPVSDDAKKVKICDVVNNIGLNSKTRDSDELIALDDIGHIDDYIVRFIEQNY
ncbi:hypothetical protein BB561_006088 [Smittium simulii]|uniref:Helicase SWR1 n=1 Tax=Smittium simulii TaxID=133385 RepID=A0A2T9Y6N6_9FUNG|nr:hypothetical protein BB561_006088 [Smittium simulii]